MPFLLTLKLLVRENQKVLQTKSTDCLPHSSGKPDRVAKVGDQPEISGVGNKSRDKGFPETIHNRYYPFSHNTTPMMCKIPQKSNLETSV
jgi:hypothetical protein